MSTVNTLTQDRRRDAKLRVAMDHYEATRRSIERHLLQCDACWTAYTAMDGVCVACDTGRLIRGEWAMALARKTELAATAAGRAMP